MPARSAAFGAIDARMPQPLRALEGCEAGNRTAPGLPITGMHCMQPACEQGPGHPHAGGAVWFQLGSERNLSGILE